MGAGFLCLALSLYDCAANYSGNYTLCIQVLICLGGRTLYDNVYMDGMAVDICCCYLSQAYVYHSLGEYTSQKGAEIYKDTFKHNFYYILRLLPWAIAWNGTEFIQRTRCHRFAQDP